MAERKSHRLVVIGAGPGGYVAAIRAAQLGWDVACVDREEALGGTCLRVGCIPSKALLESSQRLVEAREALAEHGVKAGKISLDLPAMLKRKERIVSGLTRGVAGLFQKNGVTRYHGHARLLGGGRISVEEPGGAATEIEAEHILIATGSVPATLPGVELDGDRIGDSTAALSYPEVPEKLVVIGAGYIGLELGSVWSRLGSEVTVLEYLDHVLPGMDAELAKAAHKAFERQGIRFELGAQVTAAKRKGKGCVVERKGGEPVACDRVLLCVGRKPCTDGLGLEAVGVDLDEHGRIPVPEVY